MIVKVKNKTLSFFNNFSIDLKYDSMASTFSFNYYFDPDVVSHRLLAQIGGYYFVTLEHNGELILTGRIINHRFTSSPKPELAKFAGYSLAGVLEDCNIPISLYPLQSDGLTLREIAGKLIEPFRLNMVVDDLVADDMDLPFEQTTANETQTIKSYLTQLATQRNIVISHNQFGDLVFTKAITSKPAILEISGDVPGISLELEGGGQGMHDEIAILKDSDPELGAAEETLVKNPYVNDPTPPFERVFRSKVKTISEGDDNDIDKASRTAISEELKNIKLTVSIDRWDINGKIIKPNNIIYVTDKKLTLYKRTKWFIESVTLTQNEKEQKAVLNCYLPEVYNGETPKNIFT